MCYNVVVHREKLRRIVDKMRSYGGAHASETSIRVFENLYTRLVRGVAGDAYIREDGVKPVVDIREIDETATRSKKVDLDAISKTVVVKLNGGLGTTMGLNKAKSLLPVVRNGEDELTFLDVAVRQILQQRAKYSVDIPLILMNSTNTSEDTLQRLSKYENFAVDSVPIQIMQHYEPKITADSFEAVSYPENPRLEWCPPGHGNFFVAIYDNNTLGTLLNCGYKYAFISNSDNLGAVFDPHILSAFVSSGAGIMLELADKTADDIKGGHVVRRSDGQFTLREVAQIHPDDRARAVSWKRHPYFNTNSLWIDLEQLHDKLEENAGVLNLPLIKNIKTVNPVDPRSQKVIQLETAIGSAISCFSNSTAIKVSRSRFIPVKTIADYDRVCSSAYALDDEFCLRSSREDKC